MWGRAVALVCGGAAGVGMSARAGMMEGNPDDMNSREKGVEGGAVKGKKDCPACNKSKSDFNAMLRAMKIKGSPPPSPHESEPSNTSPRPPAATPCPPDIDEIGNAAWILLHTMAANFPPDPTREQRNHALAVLYGLTLTYPCSHCAADYQEDIRRDPPDVTSRRDFSLWVCRMHNTVNQKLGKEEFPCQLEALDERWKQSSRKECQ